MVGGREVLLHLSSRGGWQTLVNGGTVTDSKKTERLIRVWDPQGERFEPGRCHLATRKVRTPRYPRWEPGAGGRRPGGTDAAWMQQG